VIKVEICLTCKHRNVSMNQNPCYECSNQKDGTSPKWELGSTEELIELLGEDDTFRFIAIATRSLRSIKPTL
jgi:hypothetical protein